MTCPVCGVDFTKVGPLPVTAPTSPPPRRGRRVAIGVAIACIVAVVSLVTFVQLGDLNLNLTFFAGSYVKPAPGVILFRHGVDPRGR